MKLHFAPQVKVSEQLLLFLNFMNSLSSQAYIPNDEERVHPQISHVHDWKPTVYGQI